MSTTTQTVVADPKRPYKAYAATALAFLTILVSAWISDDGGVTGKDIAAWVVSALIGSGLTGAATFRVPNPKVAAVAVAAKYRGEGGYVRPGALGLLGGLGAALLVIGVLLLILALVHVLAIAVATCVIVMVVGAALLILGHFVNI